jgi:hypothetical protein
LWGLLGYVRKVTEDDTLIELLEICPSCGGRLKLKALVIEAHNIERLLRHLGEPLQPPRPSPARDPPYFKSQVLRRKLGQLN